MPFRAFRLLAFPTASESTVSTTLSFASTLELAAGQAWTRRATASAPVRGVPKHGLRTTATSQVGYSSTSGVHESYASGSNLAIPLKYPKHKAGTVTDMDTSRRSFTTAARLHNSSANGSTHNWREVLEGAPRIVNPQPNAKDVANPRELKKRSVLAKISYKDFIDGNSEPKLETHIPDPPTAHTHVMPPGTQTEDTSSSNAYSEHRSQGLPAPRSSNDLYYNLLHLVNDRKPPAPLPSLVDYHGQHPHYHSPGSYNLLIDLSLRHRLYGTAFLLFRSMDRYRISRNLESHKLMIQCLVRQGFWDRAWSYLEELLEYRLLSKDEHGQRGVPFPIWVAFFQISRYRRDPVVTDGQSDEEEYAKVLQERYHTLQHLRPTRMPPLSHTPPYAIHSLVALMLKVGDRSAASSLTKAYLTALPQPLAPKFVFGCLQIIHALINSRKVDPGQPGYYDCRKQLFKFLNLHPSLQPNETTLLLLFNKLKKAKRCGTTAWKELELFKAKFGPGVVSRRVLRRVSQLALKEGRSDITRTIRDAGQKASRCLSKRSVKPMTHTHCRIPFRSVYPRRGQEARIWLRHRVAVRRKLHKLSEKRCDTVEEEA